MTTDNEQQHISQANQLAEALADRAWKATAEWGEFAKSTVGLPLIQSVDGIGLQLAMSLGRKSVKEHMQYISLARKSLTPASYWLQRAAKRGLVDGEEAQSIRAQMHELVGALDKHAHLVMQRSQAQPTAGADIAEDGTPDVAEQGAAEVTTEQKAPH